MSTATPEQLAYREFVGSRIRLAREEQGWSQAELAAKLGLSEEDMGLVEQGRHPLEVEHFQRLDELFEQGLDFFSDVFLLDGRERFSWRVEEGTPGAAVERLQARAERWVGLLRRLYIRDGRLDMVREGPALLLEPQLDAERARAMAGQLGLQLGLGPIAAERLVEKVESELGIPVLFVDTDPDEDNPGAEGILSGTCHLRDLDVILVNRRRSVGERLFGLAHELFHVLTWDEAEPQPIRMSMPPEQVAQKGNQGPQEAAEHFAASLLLPRTSLDWASAPERARNVDHLCRAANLLRVEPRLLAWHLRELGMDDTVSPGDLPAPVPPPDSALPKPFSRDFIALLHEGTKISISGRRAAEALAMAGQIRGLADLFLEYDLEPVHPYF